MGVLDGKVAIVTGAGQGIGRGIALAFAKEGAVVSILELNPETGARTADEIRVLAGRVLAIRCDVGKRVEVNAAVSATVREFNTVDILVNNAMAYDIALLEHTTDDQITKVLNSALLGTFYCMQACFPYLKEKGGKIINFASSAGTEGLVAHAAYSAAKAAIAGLTRTAALEWAPYKINVNAIAPVAATPAWEVFKAAHSAEEIAAILARNPMGRMGDPEKDIGRVAVFLAGPDSDYITSRTLMVDGGISGFR